LWLSANFPHQFEALCRVIHAEDLLRDDRFASATSRTEYAAELKAVLAQRLVDCSADELEPQLMRAGCPAVKVRTTRDVLGLPLLREREVLQLASVPGRDAPVTLVNAGFVADHDGPGLQRGVPELGSDTDAVLTELGYDAAEILSLRERGAI
jgi:crotonobetainyl-CoA:carnitine CoA-transferase CaiB-like acyl-CoA transferase